MIGLTLDLGGKSWGVGDFKGWNGCEHSEFCKWTEDDRLRGLGEVCMFVADLLIKAKVRDVSKLAGIPVEAIFDGNLLKSWRVLEEVL